MKINWDVIAADIKEVAKDHWKEILMVLGLAVGAFVLSYTWFREVGEMLSKCSPDTQILTAAILIHAWLTIPKEPKP